MVYVEIHGAQELDGSRGVGKAAGAAGDRRNIIVVSDGDDVIFAGGIGSRNRRLEQDRIAFFGYPVVLHGELDLLPSRGRETDRGGPRDDGGRDGSRQVTVHDSGV